MNSKENTEERSTEITDQVFSLINETLQNYKLKKSEFYNGCFANDYLTVDAASDTVEISQLYRWAKNENTLTFTNKKRFIIASKTKWLQKILSQNFVDISKQEEEIIKHRLLGLLPELLQKKVAGNNFSVEQVISLVLIHNYCNRPMKKCTDDGKHSFCESDHEMEKIKAMLAQKNIILIQGKPLIGKTTLAFSYLKKEKYSYDAFDYTGDKDYEKIEQGIEIEEELLLKELSEDFAIGQGMSLNDYLKINTQQKRAIIIDNFNGSKKELEQLFKLVEDTKTCLFVITQKDFPDVKEIIRITGVSKVAATEYFFSINPKENNNEEKLIEEIAEKLFGQNWILLLITQWYRKYRERNAKNALVALEELNKEMDDVLTIKLENDIEFRYHSNSNELNLLGHIRGITKNYLKTVESNTYMLLSCLTGTHIPEKYLVKWLHITPEQLAEMNRIGWCEKVTDEGKSKIKVVIPKLIAIACNLAKDRKSSASVKVINRFMETFSKELRNEEVGNFDTADIQLIIMHLHQYCISSMKYKKSEKQCRIIRSFHLDCIRYYLLMCDYNAASGLYSTWREPMGTDENNITIRVLKAYMEIVGGDTKALVSLETNYLKPLMEENKQFEIETYHELQEIIIIILRAFWTNYERWILEFRRKEVDILPIKWKLIENYTEVLKVLSHRLKNKSIYENEMKHYQSIFQMENRVNGFWADDYNAFYDLKSEADFVIQKKNCTRAENIRNLRFLLDFQFVMIRHIIFVPLIDKRMFCQIYEILINEIKKIFEDNNGYLPDDVKIKSSIVWEYAMLMNM